MRDNIYPGLDGYSEGGTRRIPVYSNPKFERLISLPPIMARDREGFQALLGDLQANILLHHRRSFCRCYFLAFEPGKFPLALQWIQELAGKITPAAEQFEEKARSKKKGAQTDTPPVYCLYLTAEGYSALGLTHLLPLDMKGAFREGLRARIPDLFENGSQPDPLFSMPKHAMVLVAKNKNDFDGINKELPLSIPCPASVAEQDGMLLFGKDKKGVEWFGYKDGFRQPLFFPQEQSVPGFSENDLSPLRIALVRDRGGRSIYSAGSFLAFLKIEQDVRKFRDMEKTIAAHLALHGIAAAISGKQISGVVKNIRTIKNFIVENKEAKKFFIGEASNAVCGEGDGEAPAPPRSGIRHWTQLIQIASVIAESKVGALTSLMRDRIPGLLAQVAELIEELPEKNAASSKPGFSEKLEQFVHSYHDAVDVLTSQTGIALLNNEVIQKIIGRIDSANCIERYERERLGRLLDKAFFIDETKKTTLFRDAIAAGKIKLFGPDELEKLLRKSKSLAEGYIMGRFRDGTPVTLSDKPENSAAPDQHFSYYGAASSDLRFNAGDDEGIRCPFSAHTRKANPRLPGQQRLILRRGVFYAEQEKDKVPDRSDQRIPGGEVGMLFMSFQSDLAEQFEYIFKAWVNSTNFNMQATGVDILAGTGVGRELSKWYLPLDWGNEDPDHKMLLTPREIEPCIRYKGGAYFFAPSISFLKSINSQSDLTYTRSVSRDLDMGDLVKGAYKIRQVKLIR